MDLPDQGLSTPREAVLPRYCRYRHRHTLHLENDDDRRFPIPDQKVDGKDGSREPDPPHGREGVHYSGVSDGTTYIILSGHELLEKLAAIVPPPRSHTTRYHGILAPNSKLRAKVVPAESGNTPSEERKKTGSTKYRLAWAALLSRVFQIDVSVCSECGGRMLRDPLKG
jgi:hypothetical protein